MKRLHEVLKSSALLTAMSLGLGFLPALGLSGCGSELNPDELASTDLDRTMEALSQIPKRPHKELCTHDPAPGKAHCLARMRLHDDGIKPFVTAGPQGFTPADLRSAYNLPTSGGNGKIIAIVDAQDDPNAEADLAVYRSQFGLPPCTTANGCFKKVNQNGTASPLPAPDQGWAGEIALDLDMASAACPDCKILLVEASSTSLTDLGTAVNTAVKLGAAVVSNSWGGGESSGVASYDATWFNHPGVAITVSAGDDGYGPEYPATSRYVTSVGGTSLVKSTSARGWSEAVWGSAANTNGGTGSGCSRYITKPTWQKDTGCTKRTSADVAAVADPNTGVAVYNTYGAGGWLVFGGTSAAAPIVAGIYAVTGNSGADGSLSYTKPTAFYDVTTGANGSCSGSYLCTAKAGYDGPTGIGTPNGGALKGGGTCVPSCSGKTCGSDGCGGTCGTCASGQSCSSAGQCTVSSTCSHSTCTSGGKLTATCDSCASTVCASDSYCCQTAWDSICVSEAGSLCHLSC